MSTISFTSIWRSRRVMAIVVAALIVLATVTTVYAFTLLQISSDTYTNATSQHATQVEPDTFAAGSTIVMATQTGRFFDGGASNIAFSTSTNGGSSWTTGNLPGITKHENPANPYDRVSDPAVAYDAQDNVWMISSLALLEGSGGPSGAAVLTSRSTDGGITWGNPVVVSDIGDVDKNWIVCDNTSTSSHYGNCYTAWDVFSEGDRLYMSTSTDGGQTWGTRTQTGNAATGLGGQPVVQPNGTVIVPAANANETAIIAFRSTDGGANWSNTVTVSAVADHAVAGGLRSGPLPSAEIDSAGKVYVVWQDCRFRRGCKSNDIVMSTSTDGLTWSSVVRIPIDATGSSVDHFIPGLAVDKSTSGGSAKLGLTFYYYPQTRCKVSNCQLDVGYVSSATGGASWTAPIQLAGPMSLSWVADTSQGRMVGDYISTSFSNGNAVPAFAVAAAPSGGVFNEATFTATGLSAAGVEVKVRREQALSNASDHAAQQVPVKHR